MSEEDKKKLEEEFARLNRTPQKSCKWIKGRIEYGTFWAMGFLIGLREGLNMR